MVLRFNGQVFAWTVRCLSVYVNIVRGSATPLRFGKADENSEEGKDVDCYVEPPKAPPTNARGYGTCNDGAKLELCVSEEYR